MGVWRWRLSGGGGRKTRAEDEGPFTYHCEVKVWRKGVEEGS